MRRFTAGTRGSALALWQTRHVTALLSAHTTAVTERVIATKGDVSAADRLQGTLEKGFFTKELEEALRSKEIDWAVHSLKDLPTRQAAGLTIAATVRRAAAGDLLLLRPDAYEEKAGALPIKQGATVGSSSLRREALLRHYNPTAILKPMRGNIHTRLEKLRKGVCDGIFLAEAGVLRLQLNLSGLVVLQLNPQRWVCAPGQGAIGVQCRVSDVEVSHLLATCNDAVTYRNTAIERAFLQALEGGCTAPFGAFVEGDIAHLGLATDTGWKWMPVAVPTGNLKDGWIQTQLDRLATKVTEENYEWLTRRI